jgi:hypothetical protein
MTQSSAELQDLLAAPKGNKIARPEPYAAAG